MKKLLIFVPMRYVLIVLILSGCNFLDDQHYEVDTRLQKYVNEFYRQSELRGLDYKPYDLIVAIRDIGDDCKCDGITYHKTILTIFIDKSFYEKQIGLIESNPERAEYFDKNIEITIFHELGHGLLNLGHSSGIMSGDGMPSHEYATYSDRREEYIDQLFK